MNDGAFIFHPLRVYDGSATVSLEGIARYRQDPARPRFDLTATAKDYPIERLLSYLDLDYPITGRLSGSFPLSGTPPDAVSGGGLMTLEDAVVWGQPLPLVTGRATLSPGRFELDEVRAELDGGTLGGRGSIAFRDKSFEVRAAGDAVPIEELEAVAKADDELSGKLTFELTGSGDVRPAGHDGLRGAHRGPVPRARDPGSPGAEPRGAADEGRARGKTLGARSLDAHGDGRALRVARSHRCRARRPRLPVVRALHALRAARGRRRRARCARRVRLARPGRRRSRARSRSRRHGWTRGGARACSRSLVRRRSGSLNGASRSRACTLSARGSTSRSAGRSRPRARRRRSKARISGTSDAAVLDLVRPGFGLSGRLTLDIGASGTVDEPAFNGSVRIEDGRYRAAGYSFEDIEGTLRLVGSSGEIDGLRARVAEGEAFVAGSFRLDGGSLDELPAGGAGPADLGARDPGAAPGGRRRPGGLGRSGGPGGPGRGDAASRDVHEGRRPHRLRPALEEPPDRRARGARALEGAHASRRAHRVGRRARDPEQRRAPLGDRRPDGPRHPRGSDPARAGAARRGGPGRVLATSATRSSRARSPFPTPTRIAPFVDLRARADVKGYDLVVALVGTWPRDRRRTSPPTRRSPTTRFWASSCRERRPTRASSPRPPTSSCRPRAASSRAR